jgi:hypothetical protein
MQADVAIVAANAVAMAAIRVNKFFFFIMYIPLPKHIFM